MKNWFKKYFYTRKSCTSSDDKSSQNKFIHNQTQNKLIYLALSQVHHKIINDFEGSDNFKKYGTKIQQGIIDEWLKEKCGNQSHRRVLKEIINDHFKIETSRKENSLLTIC